MHWKLKGIVQKVLGVLPGGHAIHYALQRRFGGLGNFASEFDSKIEDWHIMVLHLRAAGMPVTGRHLFEVGTGWYPTFPLALALAGARRVTTVDLNRHLKPELLRACIERLGSAVAIIAAATDTDPTTVRERHARLLERASHTLDLGALSDGVIAYHAPTDATRSGLADASVDTMFSNSVLEHVPPDVIDSLYAEGMRVLVPGGVMFHSVNCGDHYAYVDHSIDQLHYLRYSDTEWKRWNNAFLYQNRLRAHAFVERARAAGFAIELDTAKASERRLRELAATPVHAQFRSIPAERLCITSVDFIARKPRT
ncbi:MAG TPA: class I SAM-dependent methyltransferase [Dokdonella sp.]|uniref:class I SAM-dependent methyltransferase n=1 Tax=Dokdonella sp. TaxID=2291710 RepID=UPI0025C73238|nr:class I SAM-dependent methyltransferase [Dokdonella sp.]MBX3691675.1 class I SAM-dependent methyltransferase [Dokdonella sp.]MCW5567175.1 class I SAM-dependent methyltransferase [Dokdonella sp.]HNR91839.1 class I SAM-dependent methyltransferase [Dokdonella sp.]